LSAVDVWSVALNAGSETLGRLYDILSVEERDRAQRFVTEALRMRFTIARAALRIFLGRYLQADPHSLKFDYSERGKPFIRGSALDFNLSHSADLAIYAFTRGGEIGIDVEKRRDIAHVLDIARRYFAANEYAQLAALPPHLQVDAFFRCWTRKEAYLKATGEGIAAPLDAFEVTLLAGDAPALRHIAGDTAAAKRWDVHHLAPAGEYIGALAAPRRIEIAQQRAVSAEALISGVS